MQKNKIEGKAIIFCKKNVLNQIYTDSFTFVLHVIAQSSNFCM